MSAPSPKLEAVTFDAAGTLIHLAESVGESYSSVARRFDIYADPTALDSAFRTVWKRTPAPFTKQQGAFDESTLLVHGDDDDPEKEWWRELVRNVFAELNLAESDRFDSFFETLYDYFEEPGCWLLDEAAVEVLDFFKNDHGLKIGLLSNFDHRLRRILRDMGVFNYFDGVVLSGEIRASKPDPRMFTAIQSELGIAEPAAILHVGDEPVCDIEGAEQVGFQSFRVKPGTIPLRALLSYDFGGQI